MFGEKTAPSLTFSYDVKGSYSTRDKIIENFFVNFNFYCYCLIGNNDRQSAYELFVAEFLDSLREADLFRLSSLASLASFCRWAKILAYSAAAWRFFSARFLFRAKRWRFRCNMIGVTSRWTFGALNCGFFPSFTGRGLLITYWHTLSYFVKLKSFLILEALLGPKRRGIVLSVSPGICNKYFCKIKGD